VAEKIIRAPEGTKMEVVLGQHGGDRKSAAALAAHGNQMKNQVDDGNLIPGGNRKSYLLARLARDAPEILDDLKAGKSITSSGRSASL